MTLKHIMTLADSWDEHGADYLANDPGNEQAAQQLHLEHWASDYAYQVARYASQIHGRDFSTEQVEQALVETGDVHKALEKLGESIDD